MELLLRKIVKNDSLHLRWLETLSHLENCGARKIHKVQPSREVPVQLLQHAAEEARHALVFKLFSRKLSRERAGETRLMGMPLGRRYLEILDLYCARLVRRKLDVNKNNFHRACYLLTTYAIEKRADELYPLYEGILRELEASFSLAEIIREETQHLKIIARQIDCFPGLSQVVPDIIAYETQLFLRWQKLLAAEVA
jgi:hypothetical protein